MDELSSIVHKNDKNKNYTTMKDANERWINALRIIIVLLSALVIVVYFSLLDSSKKSINYFQILTESEESTDSLTVGQYNDNNQDDFVFKLARSGYEPIITTSGVTQYEFLSDFNSVVEPYVDSQLWIQDIDPLSYYNYSICSKASTNQCYLGTMSIDNSYVKVINVPCEPYEEFSLKVTQYSIEKSRKSNEGFGSVICMYVRREIRSLISSDLTDLMDAMHTMWVVDEEEGQERYGEYYHDSTFLLKFHHFNSAWRESDHIHEGNGFLMQHIKMTNIFERSIQAVNPAVSLPYWDFTIDEGEGKQPYESIIFSPTIFGSMNKPSDVSEGFTWENDNIVDAAIPDGRWAFIKSEPTSFEELYYGYGFMRAPWSFNPSPYISRFTADLRVGISLPSCKTHYAILQENDMMDFFYDIQNEQHATAHSLVGGIFGCDVLYPLLEAGVISDEINMKTICSQWIFYLKEFYRYNYITPYSNCSFGELTGDNETDALIIQESASSCNYECNSHSTEAMMSNLKVKVFNHVPQNMTEDDWSIWKDFLCESKDGGKVYPGDHLESASPADPSFWVIHPTLERLLHAKLMVGGFDVEDWDETAADACRKSTCYMEEYGAMDEFDECCYGHYEFDRTLDFITGNKSNVVGDTNSETFIATDPRSSTGYQMRYIYDNFEWSHCAGTADFNELLQQLKSKSSR
jgi:hypothetical protein